MTVREAPREKFEAYVREWRTMANLATNSAGKYRSQAVQHQFEVWQASRQQALEEAEKAHAGERLELHLLRDRFESQRRLTNSALATLAEKRAYMDHLDARDAVWPTKRAVGLRLQAVPVYQRQSYDVLWNAACRGIDDAIRSLTTPTKGPTP